MKKMKLILFVLPLLITTAVIAQSKLTVGKKLNVTQTTTLNNTSNMMGTSMTTSIYDTVKFVVEIKSIADSTITLTCTLKNVKGLLSMMGQEQAFNSDDATTTANPMLASILSDMNKAQEFKLVNGKIKSDAKSLKNLTEEFSPANGIVASSEALITDLFIPASVKEKVKGYQWTSEQTSEDGNQKAITIYSIAEANNSNVEITSNTSISAKGTSKMMGYDVKQNLTGTRTTSQKFAPINGLLTSSIQTIALKGTAELMSTNIPIDSKSETKTIVE